MNKSRTLLLMLLMALTLGASAQLKTAKAPRLYGLKTAAQGEPTAMRDSIVSRNADGSLRYKTTYTYDEHGYLTSVLTRYSDGTYDDTDKSYFVDYEFDAQDRCTLRSVSRCQPNGQRGEETERTEAYYGHDGYYYYEIRYEWNNGRRYAAEEIGYDQWMNPVYGIGREYDDDRLEVTYVARQQFTGRAYASKEGRLDLVLHHRLVSSVVYDKPYIRAEKYEVEGMRREMITDGDVVRTTYYKLDTDDRRVALDDDLTPYWIVEHQLVWQLNAAHTRPLSLRYYDEGTQVRPDQSVDFVWDDKDRLTKVIMFNYSSSAFNIDRTSEFTYADEWAPDMPLSRLLDVEDNDSWEDGGLDEGYEGDLVWNWFGRLAMVKYSSVHYPIEDYTMTVDAWDEDGRFTHVIQTEDDGELEGWVVYREDGKVKELIAKNEDDEPGSSHLFYEKEVWIYDRWGIVDHIEFYEAESLDGPWVKTGDNRDDYDYDVRSRGLIRRAYDFEEYQEGNWWVEKQLDTDDEGNIIYGSISKSWQGQKFRYILDAYKELRGPLEYVDYADDIDVWQGIFLHYVWIPEEKRWMLAHKEMHSEEAYAHTRLSDGRIQNEVYRWDEAKEDMVFDRVLETLTLDEQSRLVEREADGKTDRFSYYGDMLWLLTAQWGVGITDRYYYSDHNYIDPDLLSIDERKAATPAVGAWYNLQGQHLGNVQPTAPGIYVHEGRKTVVR